MTYGTPKQMATRLGVSAQTLAKWRHLGTGPQFCKLGRAVRYSEEAINEWLVSRSRASTSQGAR